MITITDADRRNILATAARNYPKRALPAAIDAATRDYCDDPRLTDDDLDRIADSTLTFFNSI